MFENNNYSMRDLINLVERVCKTPGSIYDIEIHDDEIAVDVILPDEVKLDDIEDHGDEFEDILHDEMEKAVEEIVNICLGDIEAEKAWKKARKNDKL